MKTATLRVTEIMISQLILFIFLSTFALSAVADEGSSNKNNNETAFSMLLAKGQPYVPPKDHNKDCV